MIYLDLPLNLIQQVRLIHAIAETGFPIYIPLNESYKLEPLQVIFGMEFKIGSSDIITISQLTKINHQIPKTKIGTLERCIIFPHSITTHLKHTWQKHRNYKFSFVGLITIQRKYVIEKWLKNRNPSKNYQLRIKNSLSYRLINKVLFFFKIQIMPLISEDEIYIWSSNKGRNFPVKTWDEKYFRVLANSEFVLCPSGDYIWSYRFFEAVLCGAIPIIEEYCDVYEGFIFKYMNEQSNGFRWDKEDAEYNYNLCIERITIPIENLIDELTKFNNK